MKRFLSIFLTFALLLSVLPASGWAEESAAPETVSAPEPATEPVQEPVQESVPEPVTEPAPANGPAPAAEEAGTPSE